MMKKMFAVLLALLAVCSLSGCKASLNSEEQMQQYAKNALTYVLTEDNAAYNCVFTGEIKVSEYSLDKKESQQQGIFGQCEVKGRKDSEGNVLESSWVDFYLILDYKGTKIQSAHLGSSSIGMVEAFSDSDVKAHIL